MRNNQQNHLTVMIDIKDKQGRVVGRKEVARYAGLLAKAHDEGLRQVTTTMLQIPNKENHQTAIVLASIQTTKGMFTGIGDASPENVRANIAPHLIRMAETRAKARALRDAVNIGVVALEELGELLDDELSYEGMPQNHESTVNKEQTQNQPDKGNPRDNRPQPQPDKGNGGTPSLMRPPTTSQAAVSQPASDSPFPPSVSVGPSVPLMSEAQRRMLFRMASQFGVKPEEAKPWLEKQLGNRSLREVTKAEASRLIDLLQAKHGNGGHSFYQQEARP